MARTKQKARKTTGSQSAKLAQALGRGRMATRTKPLQAVTPPKAPPASKAKKSMKKSKQSGKNSGKLVRLRNDGQPFKKRRCRPGTKALREIAKYQKSTDHLVSFAPISRVVREIANDVYEGKSYRFSKTAILAVQEAAEAYLVSHFIFIFITHRT